MRRLDVTVFEPGDEIATMAEDGRVVLWVVDFAGTPSPRTASPAGPLRSDGIEELNLSVRPYNVLKREGVNTIGALLDLYEAGGSDALDNMRNMGQRARDEIVHAITALGGGSR